MLQIAQQGPSLLEGEARGYEDAEEYLFDLFEQLSESVLYFEYDDFLADIYTQPYDAGLESRQVGNAFSLGMVLGLRLTKELVPSLVASNMGASHLESVDEETPVADVFDAGDRGYAKAAAFHPLIEEWEKVAFSDPSLWMYFRRGFGLIMGDILAAAIITSEQGPDVPMLEILELDSYDREKAVRELPSRSN